MGASKQIGVGAAMNCSKDEQLVALAMADALSDILRSETLHDRRGDVAIDPARMDFDGTVPFAASKRRRSD